MSQPSSANPSAGEVVQKQKVNVYTIMLILAVLFIITGCVLLYLELKEYGAYPWWDTTGARPATSYVIPADSPPVV